MLNNFSVCKRCPWILSFRMQKLKKAEINKQRQYPS